MPKRPSDPMTLPEAAEYSGLSVNTLRIQARTGRLVATKRGRDWLVTRKAMDAYLKNVAR